MSAVQSQKESMNDLEREKKRLATIGKIMAEISPDVGIADREAHIKSALANLGGDAGDINALSGPFEELRKKLVAAETQNAAMSEEISRLKLGGAEVEQLRTQLREAETNLARLGEEYAGLLEKKIAQESETNETATAVQELTVSLSFDVRHLMFSLLMILFLPRHVWRPNSGASWSVAKARSRRSKRSFFARKKHCKGSRRTSVRKRKLLPDSD